MDCPGYSVIDYEVPVMIQVRSLSLNFGRAWEIPWQWDGDQRLLASMMILERLLSRFTWGNRLNQEYLLLILTLMPLGSSCQNNRRCL